MKLKIILLVSLVSLAIQAGAEEAIVIDSGMLGEQPSATTPEINAIQQGEASESSQAGAATVSQADANKERILKGGKMSARQKAAIVKAEISDSNKQLGEAFLASNKTMPGVVSLASGVQYKILRVVQGRKPTEASVVACRYQGTLIDGTVFDKSETKKSVDLSVSGFLPGLKEAVLLMPAGSKWQIVIPPQLAYGELGGRGVGPNAVLIYDMEIVKIK